MTRKSGQTLAARILLPARSWSAGFLRRRPFCLGRTSPASIPSSRRRHLQVERLGDRRLLSGAAWEIPQFADSSDADDTTASAFIQISGGAYGPGFEPSISADGTRIAYRTAAGQLVLYDHAAERHRVLVAADNIRAPLVSPDGSRIFYERRLLGPRRNDSPSPGLYAVDSIGTELPFHSPEGSRTPTSSTDGNLLAHVREIPHYPDADIWPAVVVSTSQVVVTDLSAPGGVSSLPITSVAPDDGWENLRSDQPMISADGSRVVFVSNKDLNGGNPDQNDELFLYELSTGELKQLTHTLEAANVSPSISQDGSRVVFRSNADLVGKNPGRTFELFLLNTSDLTYAQLTHSSGGSDPAQPALSAEGNRVAFVSARDLIGDNSDGNAELFVFDVDAEKLFQVTQTTDFDASRPTISADGTRVAFQFSGDLNCHNASQAAQIYLATLPPAADPSVSVATEREANIEWESGEPSLPASHTAELECRRAFPAWHNSRLDADANGDGRITPVDALLVSNAFESHGVGPLVGNVDPSVLGFVDINGDRRLTAVDLLLAVNHLNVHGGHSRTDRFSADVVAGDNAESWDPVLLPAVQAARQSVPAAPEGLTATHAEEQPEGESRWTCKRDRFLARQVALRLPKDRDELEVFAPLVMGHIDESLLEALALDLLASS